MRPPFSENVGFFFMNVFGIPCLTPPCLTNTLSGACSFSVTFSKLNFSLHREAQWRNLIGAPTGVSRWKSQPLTVCFRLPAEGSVLELTFLERALLKLPLQQEPEEMVRIQQKAISAIFLIVEVKQYHTISHLDTSSIRRYL